MGIWYELKVLHFAQLSHVSQPKACHHTAKSGGLGWETRKVGAPLSWALLSWRLGTNPGSFLIFALGTEQKLCCWQLLRGGEQ